MSMVVTQRPLSSATKSVWITFLVLRSVYRLHVSLLHRQQSAIQVSDNNLPRKSYFLMSIIVTKDDVMRYIKNRPEYKKVNAFKDMRVDIYI